MRVALINPYIHDFVAYNLWSAPVGLYKIGEFLAGHGIECRLIDCVDAPVKEKPDGRSHIRKEKIAKPGVYRTIPRYYYRFGISKDEFRTKLRALPPVDAFLVTSHMSYWYGGVAETIEILKEVSPQTPVILGGIYATLFEEHAKRMTGADVIFKGAVNGSLLDTLSFERALASRETRPIHWSEFVPVKDHAPLITSYGCPMNCSYCAVNLLHPKLEQVPWEECFKEIELLYKKGVRHFAFYDDALLVNAERHIMPLLEKVIARSPSTHYRSLRINSSDETIPRLSFYTPVGLQARLITKEIARLLKRANFDYLRIGYETGDPLRQRETGGKVYDEDLDSGLKNLKEEGFALEDIGVFIMYGLPGQSIEEVENTVQHVKELGLRPVLTEFSPVLGTKEAAKLSHIDLNEPLLTNNTAYSHLFSLYDSNKLASLKLLTQYK